MARLPLPPLFAIAVLATTFAAPAFAFEVLPNPNFTPGRADADPTCGHATPHHSLPHALRDQILKQYGLPPGTHPDYEIDHLIPRCLGGSDDPSNLWAQPRRTIEPIWNAEAKDRLEHLVCEMVCDKDKHLDLATEQKAIAKNWIAEYRKIWQGQRAD
jgi:5-methylcytosine-specific restriction endonuclease McrA